MSVDESLDPISAWMLFLGFQTILITRRPQLIYGLRSENYASLSYPHSLTQEGAARSRFQHSPALDSENYVTGFMVSQSGNFAEFTGSLA